MSSVIAPCYARHAKEVLANVLANQESVGRTIKDRPQKKRHVPRTSDTDSNLLLAPFRLVIAIISFGILALSNQSHADIAFFPAGANQRWVIAPPPGGVQAKQGIGASSPGGVPTASAAASEPEPYFRVTWTAEANSFSDTTEANGSGTVTRRHIVMAGSTVVRKLDNLSPPFGNQDNFPFDLTVTDDYDSVKTLTGFCGGSGLYRQHHYWSIRDPGRYNFGPEQALYVNPFQINGAWYIEDPFQSSDSNFGVFDHPFSYNNHIDIIDCQRGDSSIDHSGDQTAGVDYLVPLGFPSADGFIKGDQDGNVFTVSRQFTSPIDPTPPTTVNWTFVARRLFDRDLTVERLEVTQSLQDRANSIPLVQGRRTVVRAYLGVGKDQKPIKGVTGKLTGYSGDTALGTVSPFYGDRITALPLPDWRQIDQTLNFELPIAWTQAPSLRVEVEVNDDKSVFEDSYENNKLSATVKTIACHGLSIAYVPVHYTPPEGFTPADPSPNIAVGQEFMRKIYPVSEKGLKYFPWPAVTWTKTLSTDAGQSELLSQLQNRLLMSSAPRPDRIFGWTPSLASPDNGLGYLPGNGAFGNDTESPNRWRRTFAHEVGHNYGLSHNEGGTAGRHWFDAYERKIKPANADGELLDVMVPARLEPEAWISPASYLRLMSKLCAGSPQARQAELQSATVNDNLVISGMVGDGTNDMTGTLDPFYRTRTAPTYIPPTGTPYCVKLKGADNAVLSQYCFSLGFDWDSSVPPTTRPFGMVVPYPAGLNRIELTRGTNVLSSRVASANPPTVTVNFPNVPGLSLSGVQNISWTGSDPDGDTLTYSVLYSGDSGATWIGVGNGISGNSYPLDFSSLPGGTSTLVKVMVSDGFRSAEDVADHPFSVANKPPTTAIVSPPGGASFPANTKVTLQGIGADLEDGSLGDAALSWSSDKDGALGSGAILEVNLSAGTHAITLTARDSGGLTSTATIIGNAVSASTPARFANWGMTSAGAFRLQVLDATQPHYIIQASTNLVNWASIFTNVGQNNGFEFIDLESTNYPWRFYRTKSP